MNNQEFNDWLQYHMTCIPSVRTWLNNQEDMKGVLRLWEEVLVNCSFKACTAASVAILEGKVKRPFAEETPATVRIWASDEDSQAKLQESKHFDESHNPVVCGLCRNSGVVSVYAGQKSRDGYRYGGAVACKCSLGDRVSKDRKVGHKVYRGLRRFVPGQDESCDVVPLDDGTEVDLENWKPPELKKVPEEPELIPAPNTYWRK